MSTKMIEFNVKGVDALIEFLFPDKYKGTGDPAGDKIHWNRKKGSRSARNRASVGKGYKVRPMLYHSQTKFCCECPMRELEVLEVLDGGVRVRLPEGFEQKDQGVLIPFSDFKIVHRSKKDDELFDQAISRLFA